MMRGKVMVVRLTATRDKLVCNDDQWKNRKKGALGYIKSHSGDTYYVEHDNGTRVAAYRGDELIPTVDPEPARVKTRGWLLGSTPTPQVA